MKYNLSILSPIAAGANAPAGAVTLANVITLEVDKPIEWVKKNADAMAAKIKPGLAYNALYVEALQ